MPPGSHHTKQNSLTKMLVRAMPDVDMEPKNNKKQKFP